MKVFFLEDKALSYHIQSIDEVFIALKIQDEGIGILAKAQEFKQEDIIRVLAQKSFLQSQISEIKIISSEADFQIVKDSLLEFKNIKQVTREKGFELFYFPKENIIRLAKEKKVKVLIIDDSKTICRFLEKMIEKDQSLQVVGSINNPLEAEKAIQELNPDVITLDIHMPNMNGVELLKIIYPKYQIPTIMVSSISIQEGPLVMEALENGAMDYIQKPEVHHLEVMAKEINKKILMVAGVKRDIYKTKKVQTLRGKFKNLEDKLIVIGSSTGGTRALKDILTSLPSEIPPILIVQHIPEVFSQAFAERLNESCPFEVVEAKDGDIIRTNKVYIAPGGKQMKIKKLPSEYRIVISDDAPVNRFKPSVDYLFQYVSEEIQDKKVLGIILTGMGNDGARGIQLIKEKLNAKTIAQDEKSSVVFGMPKEAIKTGCVDEVIALEQISDRIVSIFE